jgi:hypothetical protein
MKVSGLVRLGLVWWDSRLECKDLLHAMLRQKSFRERKGDTQHEGEWFGGTGSWMKEGSSSCQASPGTCQRTARRYSA